jgi:hypothetical protein
MARRDLTKEFWSQAKEERGRRESDKKYRHRVLRAAGKRHLQAPPREFDLNRIMGEAQSGDPAARAQAARSLCPCRIGWDGFQQGMDVVARLRKDPSPEVRRQALHVFEDAESMQATESRKAERDSLDSPETDAEKRARQRERQAKREPARAFGKWDHPW